MSDERVADELLEQARARLRELEELSDEAGELGERVALLPGDHFRGRWRSDGLEMRTKEGETLLVYGLWDEGGKRRFHYQNAALIVEVEAARPAVGDEVVIVRGEDRSFETQDELRTMHRYAVSSKPCPEPLPEEAGGHDGEDFPPF
jgi:hypothetical protein